MTNIRDSQTIARSALRSLTDQVAGHEAAVQTIYDGAYVIKKCKPSEGKFYHSAISEFSSCLDIIRRYLPTHHGAVRILGDGAMEEHEAVILENLTRSFKKPNVLDVKLGQQLWDEAANAEKRKRMDEMSKRSTSGILGLRLTGWQCWDENLRCFSQVSKRFGKSVKDSEGVALGLRLFMGQSIESDARKVQDIMENESPKSLPHLESGLSGRLIKELILPALDDIIDRVRKLEWRVRGGSILIIYEGDSEALRRGLLSSSPFPPPGRAASQHDVHVDIHRPPSEGHLTKERIADLRLIDFAHVSFALGQNYDPGYLLGLQNLRELFATLIS